MSLAWIRLGTIEGSEEVFSHCREYVNVVTEKGVPEFWLTAMKTNEVLGMQVNLRVP